MDIAGLSKLTADTITLIVSILGFMVSKKLPLRASFLGLPSDRHSVTPLKSLRLRKNVLGYISLSSVLLWNLFLMLFTDRWIPGAY